MKGSVAGFEGNYPEGIFEEFGSACGAVEFLKVFAGSPESGIVQDFFLGNSALLAGLESGSTFIEGDIADGPFEF